MHSELSQFDDAISEPEANTGTTLKEGTKENPIKENSMFVVRFYDMNERESDGVLEVKGEAIIKVKAVPSEKISLGINNNPKEELSGYKNISEDDEIALYLIPIKEEIRAYYEINLCPFLFSTYKIEFDMMNSFKYKDKYYSFDLPDKDFAEVAIDLNAVRGDLSRTDIMFLYKTKPSKFEMVIISTNDTTTKMISIVIPNLIIGMFILDTSRLNGHSTSDILSGVIALVFTMPTNINKITAVYYIVSFLCFAVSYLSTNPHALFITEIVVASFYVLFLSIMYFVYRTVYQKVSNANGDSGKKLLQDYVTRF